MELRLDQDPYNLYPAVASVPNRIFATVKRIRLNGFFARFVRHKNVSHFWLVEELLCIEDFECRLMLRVYLR